MSTSWLDHELSNGSDFAPRVPRIFCDVEVRENRLGAGLFAAEPIVKGRIVAIDGGVIIPATFDDFPKYGYSVLIDEHLLLAPRNYEKLESIHFINHSCDSNVARIGGLTYLAKKDIARDEELSIDYSALMAGYGDWTLTCHCESKKCREVLTSHDWRHPRLQNELWTE